MASNGSLMTAPDMRGRLRAIRGRGGKIVVVDPRRTRTAGEADEHHFIRPGTDALLLFALVQTLFAEDLVDPGERIGALLTGLDEVRALAEPFTPEAVAPGCGIAAEEIRRMARELATAPTAVVYGRIGTTTQEFGTLASWLVDVLNVLTGNLDSPGGAMFPLAAVGAANAAGQPGRGRGVRFGRFTSRVREMPELFGELPAVCMAEEIDTPGEGQVRAFITVSGNPVLSTPNSARLQAAFESLEFMVSVDVYINETTRHADVILPAPSPLRRGHYDIAFYGFSVRNIANYSPPVLEPEPELPDEWTTLLRLAGIAFGMGPDPDLETLDDGVARTLLQRELDTPQSPLAGRDADEIVAALAPRVGPERLLDLMLRAGPYGDGFGARSEGPRLTLEALEAAPHGVDLGPLQERLPDALRTAVGHDRARPRADRRGCAAAARRAGSSRQRPGPDRPPRPALQQLLDAQPAGAGQGQGALHAARAPRRCRPLRPARRRRRPAELTHRQRRGTGRGDRRGDAGVVSLPHGWGHDDPDGRMAVAGAHAGTNSNLLADETLIDAISGNAVLNGIPVSLAPA